MSLGNDDLPRDPKTRSKTYHNVEGIIRARKGSGSLEALGRSSITGSLHDPALTEADLRKWIRHYESREQHKAKDVGMRKQSADPAVIGT